MAVYTDVSEVELEAFLAGYPAGRLLSYKGIAEGSENSNFLLHTSTGAFILNPGSPDERTLPPIGDDIPLAEGDLLRIVTVGGGGWGNPLERDPERVRQDVLEGFVTVRAARDDYAVVLDPETLTLDHNETARLRADQTSAGNLFDRGA